MALQTKPWDAAEYLNHAETIFYYLEASLEGSTADHVAGALSDSARALGSTAVLAHRGHVDESVLQSAIDQPGPESYVVARQIMQALRPAQSSRLVA